MNYSQNFIGGKWVAPCAESQIELVDPTTEAEYGSIPASSEADVDEAFRSAESGFALWRDSTPQERQLALLRIADSMEARINDFAEAEMKDCGKPRAGLDEEIMLSVDQIRFFAGAARNLEGRSAGEYLKDHTSMLRREPIGVVAQIAPWNFPLNMAAWKIAPAIAAGNATVLKPSETTPSTAILLAEVAAEHLPAGVFNLVLGGRETGAAMVTHPVPQFVSITGSTRAGLEVAKAASADLKRLHLELGGNAPVVVFADADLHAAADSIAVAGYFNAGQDCTAATRVLVQDIVHDEFVAILTEKVKKTATTGMPLDPDAMYGPLNNSRQLQHVKSLVEGLPNHASIALGGRQPFEKGYFYEATIITDVQQDDRIVQEEVFGPVVTVQSFTDEAQALAYANGTRYGLSSSAWTRDHSRAMRMSRQLEFGCVWINTHIPVVAEMPHGGFKHSGYGKDLSVYGFDEYTRIKHVMSYTG